LQPQRRLGGRVDALHLADAEEGALRVLLDLQGEDVLLDARDSGEEVVVEGGRCRVERRIAVLQLEGGRKLASQAAGGQRIATVRGDVDLEDGVVQAQQAAGVVANG